MLTRAMCFACRYATPNPRYIKLTVTLQMSTKTPSTAKVVSKPRKDALTATSKAKTKPEAKTKVAVKTKADPKPVKAKRNVNLETAGAIAVVRAVKGQPGVSLLTQTVEALRQAVLEAPGPGVFLGSEEKLIAALGVSRPTFRQAAKLLRHENLLTIRRGIGGGFFTISPSGEAVSRMAAIFLNSQGTSLLNLMDVVAPLQAEAARMVARLESSEARMSLNQFIEQCETPGTVEYGLSPIPRMLAYEALLGDLTGNPAIALVMKVMRDLVRDARHSYFKLTAERIAAYEHFQQRLARAVAEGDAEMATLICDRHSVIVREWLPDRPAALTV